ncbi:SIMPL domain-containing protein [Qipengyuania sp.]|uniref:SIMPL domain-containing protein n=1 Tax=Qipengyuania sp. TaxID=2004515 RepID=UPI003736CAF7
MRSLFAALGLALLATPAAAQTEPARPAVGLGETILRVRGEGEAKAVPDRASLTVGVVTTASSPAAALEANNRQLAPVIEVLRRQGIAAEAMQTAGFTVDPQFEHSDRGGDDRITGFRVSNSVTFTTDDLAEVGNLVSSLFEAGANNVSGPDFDVAPAARERLVREAEDAALKEAVRQAEAVAASLGKRVSRILLVSDSQVDFGSLGGSSIIVTGSRLAKTPIEPGEMTVRAVYGVEFALSAIAQ